MKRRLFEGMEFFFFLFSINAYTRIKKYPFVTKHDEIKNNFSIFHGKNIMPNTSHLKYF